MDLAGLPDEQIDITVSSESDSSQINLDESSLSAKEGENLVSTDENQLGKSSRIETEPPGYDAQSSMAVDTAVDDNLEAKTEVESPLSPRQSHLHEMVADDATDITELTGSISVSELTEAQSASSSTWKFKSNFLDMELEGEEAIRLAQELHLALKASLKPSEPPKISPHSRLLEPTEAFKKHGYSKPPPVVVDAREQGWIAPKTKARSVTPGPIKTELEQTDEEMRPKSTIKVRETSSRLLQIRPERLWKGPQSTDALIATNMRKRSNVKFKELPADSHLLKPKDTSIRWRMRQEKPEDTSDNISTSSKSIASTMRSGRSGASTPFLMKSPRFGKVEEKDQIKIPKPISPHSHVLQITTSVKAANVVTGKEFVAEACRVQENPNDPRKLSKRTGPKNVESRLLKLTASMKAGAWTGPKGPTDEELEEMRLAEERAKFFNKMESKGPVSKTSERLLQYTAAIENAKYLTPEERAMPIMDENAKKVSDVSPRLLERTIAADSHVYKGPVSFPVWSDKESNGPIKVSERLLEATEAFVQSKYQKTKDDIDPRELAWKPYVQYKVPEPEPVIHDDDVSETTSQTPMKVKQTSERVLSLTTAFQNHRKQSPEQSPSPPPAKAIKPVSSSEHFLQPTLSYKISSTISARTRGMIDDDDATVDLSVMSSPDIPVRQPRPFSASLLAPTMSYRNRLNSSFLNDEASIESLTPSPISVKKVTSFEHFLAPTASFANRLSTVDENKPLHATPVRQVDASARFLSPTASSSSAQRSLSARRIGNVWLDAVSSTSSVSGARSPSSSQSISMGSIYSRTTVSSLSVKSLINAYESNNGYRQRKSFTTSLA